MLIRNKSLRRLSTPRLDSWPQVGIGQPPPPLGVSQLVDADRRGPVSPAFAQSPHPMPHTSFPQDCCLALSSPSFDPSSRRVTHSEHRAWMGMVTADGNGGRLCV